MCEEIKNASTVVPQTMLASLAINGMLAFGMLLAVLFCMGDITAAVQSPTGYPFIEIFTQATASRAGATAMTSIVTALAFCAIIAALAGSSRMTWSFARDRGLPGWRYLSKVSPTTGPQ
jgi:choline transport protein